MTPEHALEELMEVSPQIEATVLATKTGTPLAASFPDGDARTESFATHALAILDQADVARLELGREPVVQCEIATDNGHVFVVADNDHVVAAITASEPTVGLVFYDMKTALRGVRPESGSSKGKS